MNTLSSTRLPSVFSHRSYTAAYTVDGILSGCRFCPTSLCPKPVANAHIDASREAFVIPARHRYDMSAYYHHFARYFAQHLQRRTLATLSPLTPQQVRVCASVFTTRWRTMIPPDFQPRPACITLRTQYGSRISAFSAQPFGGHD